MKLIHATIEDEMEFNEKQETQARFISFEASLKLNLNSAMIFKDI
jgi:hypothetical protein